MKNLFCLIVFVLFLNETTAQMPQRKALMGLQGKPNERGILIDTVFENSTAAVLQLKKGDIILSINGKESKTLEAYNALATQVRTGDKLNVNFSRNGQELSKTVEAVMRPFEKSDIADVLYDWVKFRNGYLRTITRKPKGKTNLPAILLIPGYGCGSIENYSSSYNGKLINEWLKKGYAVVTIEKSGMGDTQGCEPCVEVDLQTDIESFDAGYNYMETLPFVDKSKLFIWGHSMGGTIAPEIAMRHKPKGVMVFACVFRPWSEFLLEMHRVQKPLMEGLTYPQTEKFLRGIQPIYHAFFNEKKSPKELFDNPTFKELVVSELGYKEGNNNMWGRHWRFWQQLDSLNLAETWQKVPCPVLVLHGTADYEQCSLVEPMMLSKTVNEAHPNSATMVVIPELDHFMMQSKDWQEAYKNFKTQQYLKGNFNFKITEETVKWLDIVLEQ